MKSVAEIRNEISTLPQPMMPEIFFESLGNANPLMINPNSGMKGISAASWFIYCLGRRAKIAGKFDS